MPRKSKAEVQEKKRELADQTDAEEKTSKEIKESGKEAQTDWGDQVEPALSDTADALNEIADALKSDIQTQHGEQAEKVEDSIEAQREEVSEPARESEGTEREAADGLDIASSQNKRFGKMLAEASESRRDAESFLREVADSDEDDQKESKETLDKHRRAIEDAIEGIEDF